MSSEAGPSRTLFGRIDRMLTARRKRWLAPLFLISIVLGRLTMRSRPVARESFIYTLF